MKGRKEARQQKGQKTLGTEERNQEEEKRARDTNGNEKMKSKRELLCKKGDEYNEN